MNKNPLVSICIPMYNSEKYITDTIESLINQTYKEIEIIIIDDGSEDKSVDMVNNIKDSRIRLYKNGINRGLPYTRNRGIDLAKGKYIALIDADDIAYLNRIKIQVDFMEKNREYGVIYSYIQPFGNIGLLSKMRIKMLFNKKLSNDEIQSKLFFSNVICNPSSIIRKSVLEKNNIKYRKEYTNSQDYGLWLDLINLTKFKVIEKKLLRYRFGHENISKKTSNKKYDIHCKLSKQLFQKINYIDTTGKDFEILSIIYLKKSDLFKTKFYEIDNFLCRFKSHINLSDICCKKELLKEVERQRYYFKLYCKDNNIFKNIDIDLSDKLKIFAKVKAKQILQFIRWI